MSVLIEFVSATAHIMNLRSVGVKVMSLFLLHKKVTSELTHFSVPAMRAFSMRGLAFLFVFMTLLCIGCRQRVEKMDSKQLYAL